MIKFFCKICRREIWVDFMKHFETFKMHTLAEVYDNCTCDDCLQAMQTTDTGEKKFRKRPIQVEATQWFKNGDHPADDCFRPFEDTGKIPEMGREGKIVRYYRHPDVNGTEVCTKCGNVMHDHGWIDTLEDGHNVCPGDWIITGVRGERYPCKPDIFQATYEPVVDKGEQNE